MLTQNLLGSTTIKVSRLGLGTVKFGRNQQVKYPTAFTIPSNRELQELLAIAKDANINLLDTAPAYGTSEERLGKLLPGQRQDWVICTKVGEEFIDGNSQFDFSAKHINFSIERSLQRLATDYLDIVLVHSCGDDLRIIDDYQVFATLAALKQRGLIRAFGMSSKTVAGGLATIEQADVAMVTYNPAQQADLPILDQAFARHKGILIKKAFASGHLHKLHNVDQIEQNEVLNTRQNSGQTTEPGTNQNMVHNIDPIKQSLQFIFKHQAVSSVIIGTINPEHLKQNIWLSRSFREI